LAKYFYGLLPTFQQYKIVEKNLVLLHLMANIGNKDDETRPIINKPKHPKKGEYEEQNARTHIQENKKNHVMG
jgi:hypothetical protein